MWICCNASDKQKIDVDDKQRPGSQSLSTADDNSCCAAALVRDESGVNVLKPSGYFVNDQVSH